MQQYDAVIIGSGLGGLLSAVLLAKEGLHVAVIEQNKQVGGCLQTFSFEKKVFDSCVHYIGALDDGQTQNRIFRYAGILDDLRLKKLDIDGFDKIIFGNDPGVFPQAQGAGNFAEQLQQHFKGSEASLKYYNDALQQVAESFPLSNLRSGHASEKEAVSHWTMDDVMRNIPDEKLKHVLMGNNLLYAGNRDKTPFYVHALVSKSYIDSAYKCVGGSSQISKLLWKKLQEYGGVIYRNERVVKLEEAGGIITNVITENGNRYAGKQFIANVHPAMVLQWIDSSLIKPIYRKRISSAENSISAFMINIVLKPGCVPHRNHNIYWNRTADSYAAVQYKDGEWPANYALYFGEDAQHEGFSDTVAVLTYMHAEEFEPWLHTRNVTAQPSGREEAYHVFKEEKAKTLIDVVAERYPELKDNIQSWQIATPLTFRDYMGSPDGSIYGIMADVNNPAQTQIPVRTKIPNLLLTGQNIGLHGVLGVSINAIAACGELVGLDYLLEKINKS
jgi:all-trans-retinol 13,14-reductase